MLLDRRAVLMILPLSLSLSHPPYPSLCLSLFVFPLCADGCKGLKKTALLKNLIELTRSATQV